MAGLIVGEIEVHVEETGSGPPLLLIGGIPAVASDWRAFAERLTGRRCIAFDNRGCGATTVTPGPCSTAQMAADAVGVLDALGISRADVMGMSMGGMIAQELALGWPQRVRRLVLGCTHCGLTHAAPQPREAGRAFALQTDDWGERIRALAPFAFAPGIDPAVLDAFVAKKERDVQDPLGYAAQIQAVLGHDTYDRLPEITAPTLVMTGDEDSVIPAPSSDVLRERIPDARLEIVPGTGHLFFLEQPELSARLVDGFLSVSVLQA